MNWYYEKNGSPEGPVEETQIEELVKRGDISPTTRVWNETMPDWLPAAESTLAGLLRAIPPRLPPRLPPALKSVSSASKPRRKFSIGKTVAAVFAIALVIAIVGNRDEQGESPRGTKARDGNGRLSAYPGNNDLERNAAAAVDSFFSALRKGKIEDALSWTSKWRDEWRPVLTSAEFSEQIRRGDIPRFEFVSSRRFQSSSSPKEAAATYVVLARDSETGEEIPFFVDHFWNNFDPGREKQFGVVPPGVYDGEVLPLNEEADSFGGGRSESASSGGYDEYPGSTQSERIAASIVHLFLRTMKQGNLEALFDFFGDNRSMVDQAIAQGSASVPEIKRRLKIIPDLVLVSSEAQPPPNPDIRSFYKVCAANPRTDEQVPFMVYATLDGPLLLFPSRELLAFFSGAAESPF